jgi:hypothetical protein
MIRLWTWKRIQIILRNEGNISDSLCVWAKECKIDEINGNEVWKTEIIFPAQFCLHQYSTRIKLVSQKVMIGISPVILQRFIRVIDTLCFRYVGNFSQRHCIVYVELLYFLFITLYCTACSRNFNCNWLFFHYNLWEIKHWDTNSCVMNVREKDKLIFL